MDVIWLECFFLNPRSLLRRRGWWQRNRRTAAPPPQATLLAATTTLTTLIGASGHRLQLQLRRKRRATTERTAPPPPPRFRSQTRFRRWRSFWPLRCQRMNTRHESICAPRGRSGGVSRVLDCAGRLLQQGDDQVLDCAGQGPVVVATAFLLALKFASKGHEIRTHFSVVSNSCVIVACLRDLPHLLGLRQDPSGLAPAAAGPGPTCPLCPDCRTRFQQDAIIAMATTEGRGGGAQYSVDEKGLRKARQDRQANRKVAHSCGVSGCVLKPWESVPQSRGQ